MTAQTWLGVSSFLVIVCCSEAFHVGLFVPRSTSRPSCIRPHHGLKCTADAGEISAKVDELVRVARAKEPPQWFSPSRYEDPNGLDMIQRLPLPGFELDSIGLRGRWETIGDNFVLRPLPGIPVRAVVHFLGGAFVGVAPHFAYRFLLESLADEGYVIIATPYKLTFSYVDLCAEIEARSRVASEALREQYGGVPLVGLGHSCGALLHVLLSAAFPQDPGPAVNVLISYNNKPAREAIQEYDRVVAPFARTVSERGAVQLTLRGVIETLADQAEGLAHNISRTNLAPRFVGAELLPLARQGLPGVEQVVELIETIGRGDAAGTPPEFVPSPAETRVLAAGRYRVPRTTLIRFDDDSLDQTPDLYDALQQREGADMAGRARVVEMVSLGGTHLTPLSQDMPSTPLDSFDPLLGLRRAARDALLAPAQALVRRTLSAFDRGLEV